MKLSAILLACSVSAAETDDSPLTKLNNLRSIGIKLILSDSDHKRMDWKEKWVRKFRFNSNRMAKNFVKRVNKNKAPFSPRDLFLKTPSFVKRNTKVGAPRPEKCKIEKPQVLYFLFQILGQPPLLYFTFTKLGANQYA